MPLQNTEASPAPPTPQVPSAAGAPREPVPTTRMEIDAIQIRRDILSSHINNVSARRDRIAEQLASAPASARAGLEERLRVLDERIVQMEQELAETGRLLTSAPAGLAQVPPPSSLPLGLDSDQITGISIVFTIFVLFPLALSFARLLWKRATTPRVKPNTADSERLERVEHAVETIAIEIERISEGQRFVTRLLAQPNGTPSAEALRRQERAAGGIDPAGGSR